MTEVVIVAACRTPIAKFQGSLSTFKATELGAFAVKEAISRAGIGVDDVEEVIMGNVLQAGLGQNPARQAAIGAGVPTSVGSFTVNKVCGSGLKTVMLAAGMAQRASLRTEAGFLRDRVALAVKDLGVDESLGAC